MLYQNAGGQSGVSYAAPMTAIDLRFGQATADEQAAEAVEALISALVFPVTEEGRPEIEAARAAYDSLTPAQQALVRNLHVLEQAEAELNRHAHDFGPWIANGDGTHSRACACGETENSDLCLQNPGTAAGGLCGIGKSGAGVPRFAPGNLHRRRCLPWVTTLDHGVTGPGAELLR